MADVGVQTTQMPALVDVDDLIGNKDGSTGRIAFDTLAARVGASLGPAYETLAEINADLAWAENSLGSVWGDGDDAVNGMYKKSGLTGAGSWVRITSLPLNVLTDQATTAAIAAALSETNSANSEIIARAAAEASGAVKIYDTKADATAALGSLSENDIIEVLGDESRAGGRSRYRVESATLVWKIDFTGQIVLVADIPELKSLSTGNQVARLTGSAHQGTFEWDSTVTIAVHQADAEYEVTYIAPNAGADGAWVRRRDADRGIIAPEIPSLRPLVKGQENYIPRFVQLPDPATMTGKQAIFAGLAPALVYSDGVDWFNLGTGVKISPWWRPNSAEIHVDWDNVRFFWGGAIKTVGDFTTNPATGIYTLDYTVDMDDVMIAWQANQPDTADQPVGVMWSAVGTPGYSAGFRLRDGGITPYGRGAGPRIYNNRITVTGDYWAFTRHTSDLMTNIALPYFGVNRHVLSHEIGQPLANWFNHSDKLEWSKAGNIAEARGDSHAFGFGCEVWSPSGDGDQTTTPERLQSWTLFPGIMSDHDAALYGKGGGQVGYHLLGDSFLNNNFVDAEIRGAAVADGHLDYITSSQDGAGATTLTQQAARYIANGDSYHDAPLVICDFGLESNPIEFRAAMETILGSITHDRWLVLEPSTQAAAGSAGRIIHDQTVAYMRAFCGDHFVPTLEAAMALSDGGAADLAKVADRLWPVSLTISNVDFHPNAAGQQFLGLLIYNALKVRGWLN